MGALHLALVTNARWKSRDFPMAN